MIPATRSAISLPLINAMINRAPMAFLDNSTLNQKLNILPNVNDGPFSYPTINYYAIGAGDQEAYIGASGSTSLRPKSHESTDSAPFRQRPFVLRPINDDLSDVLRKDYRLRRMETHRGEQYWAYYLKKLPDAEVSPTHDYVVVDGNNNRSVPIEWNPSVSSFEPSGRSFSSVGVNVINKEIITSRVPRKIVWTPFDREEYLNVARVLYDDEGEAILGDIAIVAGLDRVVSAPSSVSGSINITECILATCMAWLPKIYDAYREEMFTAEISSSIEEPIFANVGLTR